MNHNLILHTVQILQVLHIIIIIIIIIIIMHVSSGITITYYDIITGGRETWWYNSLDLISRVGKFFRLSTCIDPCVYIIRGSVCNLAVLQ